MGKAPSLVIWDFNGTLMDDAALGISVMDGMLRRRGMPGMDRKRYEQVFSFPVSEYYARLGFDFNQEPFEVLAVEYIENYEAAARSCPLREGAMQALETVARLGARQCVLSAMEQNKLLSLCLHYGIADFFADIYGLSDDLAAGKHLQGRALLQKHLSPGGTAVMLGDTPHDAEVAGALGMDCLLIEGGHARPGALHACGVAVFSSISDACKELVRRFA